VKKYGKSGLLKASLLGFGLVVLGSAPAAAATIEYHLSDCVSDPASNCILAGASGGGEVYASISDDTAGQLVFRIENDLLALAAGDDPHIKEIGFVYDGTLTGLALVPGSFDADPDGSVVLTSVFTSGGVTSFTVDFGFLFSNSDPDRFQIGEAVDLALSYTGGYTGLDDFSSAFAHVGGLGVDGETSVVFGDEPTDDNTVPDDDDDNTTVPEPGTLALFGSGLAMVAARLRKAKKA
jgi:hypothetical protein